MISNYYMKKYDDLSRNETAQKLEELKLENEEHRQDIISISSMIAMKALDIGYLKASLAIIDKKDKK